jgi:hypothetical protein
MRDPVNYPERGRVRSDRAEQRLLLANRTQVRDTLAAISEHHSKVADHPARIMTTPPLLQSRQPQGQPPRQPKLVSNTRDQRATRVRHQTRSVRRDIYGYRASITHHL